MKSLILLCLFAVKLSAADLLGDNLFLSGNAALIPESGAPPFKVEYVEQLNWDGTTNPTWTVAINDCTPYGRCDTNQTMFKYVLEMNWRRPGTFENWVESYRVIVSPDGTMKMRDMGFVGKGRDWTFTEQSILGDSVTIGAPPLNPAYLNTPVLTITSSRATNGSGTATLRGIFQTTSNAHNLGGISVKDGGALSLFAPGNASSFSTKVNTSSRSGWAGKPTVTMLINGPPRSFEGYGLTNWFFDTQRMEVTGAIKPGSICLPTNIAPADPLIPKTWIPIQGTNGQTYLVPADQ